MAERTLEAPPVNPEVEPYFEAAKNGKLMYGYCQDTNQPFFFPRAVSPFTLSNNVEMREASGRGTVYTYSVMRRTQVPYAIAYVELDEGPMMMTNIVDCDLDQIRVGMPVQVVFKDAAEGWKIPCFKPA